MVFHHFAIKGGKLVKLHLTFWIRTFYDFEVIEVLVQNRYDTSQAIFMSITAKFLHWYAIEIESLCADLTCSHSESRKVRKIGFNVRAIMLVVVVYLFSGILNT